MAFTSAQFVHTYEILFHTASANSSIHSSPDDEDGVRAQQRLTPEKEAVKG